MNCVGHERDVDPAALASLWDAFSQASWGTEPYEEVRRASEEALRLYEELGDSADVDGHDVGSGETNIFIYTSDPAATFHQARPVLARRQQLQSVTAAYRDVEGETFTVIWPEGSPKEFRVI